jgi:hypothetical protein
MAKTISIRAFGSDSPISMAYRRKSKKRKSKSRVMHRKKHYHHKAKKQKKPYTAGKRKDTSHRRIRYTKNNQPYVIMANGRARFISKKSVRISRKRKGGMY